MKLHPCLLAVLAVGAGCDLDDPGDLGEPDAAEVREADALAAEPGPPAATYSGWTPYTSEEGPPIGCDPGSLVSRFGCSGSYCDNVRMYCGPTGATAGVPYWTAYFSEEGTNYRQCASGHWVTGLSCRGRYCDDVSLQCTYYGGLSAHNCYWTGWISEEGGGTLGFGASYYAVGAQCRGSYCDNKRFLVCQP